MGRKRGDLPTIQLAKEGEVLTPLVPPEHTGKSGQGEVVAIFDLVDIGNPPQDEKDTRNPAPGLTPKPESPRLKYEGNQSLSSNLFLGFS